MKELKFQPHLAEMIRNREKWLTWRLFDDKDLSEGDKVQFIDKKDEKIFAEAILTKVWMKPFGEFGDKEFDGHEKFSTEEERYETYSRYYGRDVDKDTPVKMAIFKIEKYI